MESDLRVVVAQMGARHNYAVPRMLHQRGALSRLYTDFCLHGACGQFARRLVNGSCHSLAGKLRRRCVAGIPPSLIRSAPLVNFRSWMLSGSLSARQRYALQDQLIGEQMIKWGPCDANVVYGMFGSGTPFWRHAKREGVRVAVDVFFTPFSHGIVEREHEAYPAWAMRPGPQEEQDKQIEEAYVEAVIDLADTIICPASNVIEGLRSFSGFDPRKAKLVPYGVSVRYDKKPLPIPGQVLFAGSAVLGKGIHYLAKAANLLNDQKRTYDFIIAGGVADRVRNHPEARSLNFLGHLPKEQMIAEFLTADVFVLPTLAEGSASVVFEALAAGVPVVTTRSAGSVVTDGVEGFIVPERDSEALATAIETIVEDRDLRQAMSTAALATAADYTEERWGDRLVSALSEMA